MIIDVLCKCLVNIKEKVEGIRFQAQVALRKGRKVKQPNEVTWKAGYSENKHRIENVQSK